MAPSPSMRVTAFQVLALRLLDENVSDPEHRIVIADAIMAFDDIDSLDQVLPMRIHAADFIVAARMIIVNKETCKTTSPMINWLVDWNKTLGWPLTVSWQPKHWNEAP